MDEVVIDSEQYLNDPAWATREAERVGRAVIKDRDGSIRLVINSHRATETLLDPAREQRASEAQIDVHGAVQAIVRTMWLYSGYHVKSRGPVGCLIDAIEKLEPETARKIRAGEAGDDWSEVYDWCEVPEIEGSNGHNPDCDVLDIDPALGRATKPCNCPEPVKSGEVLSLLERYRAEIFGRNCIGRPYNLAASIEEASLLARLDKAIDEQRLVNSKRRLSVGTAYAWLSGLREGVRSRDWSWIEAIVEGMECEMDIQPTDAESRTRR